MSKTKMEEVEAPTSFCHLDGYPPLPGENLQQYLERVNPILDAKVRQQEKRERALINRPWFGYAAVAIALALAFAMLAIVAGG